MLCIECSPTPVPAPLLRLASDAHDLPLGGIIVPSRARLRRRCNNGSIRITCIIYRITLNWAHNCLRVVLLLIIANFFSFFSLVFSEVSVPIPLLERAVDGVANRRSCGPRNDWPSDSGEALLVDRLEGEGVHGLLLGHNRPGVRARGLFALPGLMPGLEASETQTLRRLDMRLAAFSSRMPLLAAVAAAYVCVGPSS